MKPLLLRRVPLMPGESLTSYASRLSACNRVPLSRFCHDLDLGARSLLDGEDRAIDRMSELSGTSRDDVERAAIRRVGMSRHTIDGELFVRSALRRLDLVVCPLCLCEDVTRVDLPPDELAYARIAWSLTQVDVCAVHDAALVTLDGAIGYGFEAHDFATRLQPFAHRLQGLADRIERRRPTGLESYLLDRLVRGAGESPWLDTHPLSAAAIVCERVGVAASHGPKVSPGTLPREALRRAGDLGYALLRRGPGGLDTLCGELTGRQRREGSYSSGPVSVYGVLWTWLEQSAHDAAFDPLRAAMAERIFSSLPLPRGARILGHVLERRRLHSIASAAEESGRNPWTLRDTLAAAGVLPNGHEPLLNWQVVFDAEAAAPYLSRLSEPLGTAELATMLGICEAVVCALHHEGLLASVSAIKGRRMGPMKFERPVVEAFVSDLFAGAPILDEAGPDEFDLSKCARKARRSIPSVLRLVLGGKLAWRARLRGATGLSALLLRAAEVTECLRGAGADDLPLKHVVKDLRITHVYAENLLRDGVLPTCQARRIGKLTAFGVVPREDFEAFKATFVTSSNLVRETRTSLKAVRRCLRAAGVTPALSQDRYGVIYRRSELAPCIDASGNLRPVLPRSDGPRRARRGKGQQPPSIASP